MPIKAPNRFWTPKVIKWAVIIFTVVSLAEHGIAGTAELYVVVLGSLLTYKILAKESL